MTTRGRTMIFVYRSTECLLEELLFDLVLCFTYSGLGLCSPSWSCILNHTELIISVSGNLITLLCLKFVSALTLRGSDVLSHPSVLSLVLEYSTLNRFNTDLMLLFKKYSSQQVHTDQASFTKPCQAKSLKKDECQSCPANQDMTGAPSM